MLKKAPLTFVALTAAILVGLWHYTKRLETDGVIERCKVALGINSPGKDAIVGLTNQELTLKTQSIAVMLRQLSSALTQKYDEIGKRQNLGEITAAQALQDLRQARMDISRAFDSQLASDAYTVENELRKRLSPQAISQVVRVPAFLTDEGRVTLNIELNPGSEIDSGAQLIRRLADEIEQMADLLPPDSRKP